MTKYIAISALLGLTTSALAAVIYSTNFETDQSANFTVRATSADATANFVYDYSTYAPTSPTDGPTSITAAPSGAGSKALRLNANFDATGSLEAVNAYVNAGTTMTDYLIRFDAFQQYNGAADVSGAGTTQYFMAGDANSANVTWQNATVMTGFVWQITGERDAGNDLQYGEGTGAAYAANNALPGWPLGEEDAFWGGIFSTASGYAPVGAPSRQWNIWEMVVKGANVTVYVTPRNGSKTQVGAWTVAGGAAILGGAPFVGLEDTFTSVAVPPQDNFVLIDNLSLETAPTAAEDWSMYQ